jgi:hypothetical protein
MAGMGKSLKFDDAEIAELCDLQYGRRRTFPVLATLYPGLDLTTVRQGWLRLPFRRGTVAGQESGC